MKDQTYTIQKTHKKFKAHGLIAFVMLCLGIYLTSLGMNAEDPSPGLVMSGPLLSVVGIVWYIINKIRIWWNHS